METFIVDVFTKLAASSLNYNIGSVSGVSVDTTAGDLLTTEIRVSILRVGVNMSDHLTPEDLAFLKKIGQIQPSAPKAPAKKDEE
jgi:hypothetical protein